MVYQKPIRVLHVFSRMDRGGAETMIMNLYRNIDRENVQFDFVVHTQDTCAYDKEILKLGGIIYHAPYIKLKYLISYLKWLVVFFDTNTSYAVIHSHLRSVAIIYILIAKMKKIPTIIHSHSTSSGSGAKAIIKNLLQFPLRYIADYLFACSLNSGEWLFGKRACKKNNFYILKNAIDTTLFEFSEIRRAELRNILQIDQCLVVGHVGRLIEAKNHTFLLRIFKKIQLEYPNSLLLIIGDGQLKEQITKEVKRLNLTHSVRLLGTREDIRDLLQVMDIMIFPSLWEGFPVTLIEAQTSGLKCFVSDCISSDVKVTDLIYYLPLNESADFWCTNILQHKDYRRKSMTDFVQNSGFDINETSKWLENFYISISS